VDVLLVLIEKAELDITVLSLAQVTDQFLAYIERMEDDNPAEVSAFIVIAARLIQIKSAALLPNAAVQLQNLDEDSGESLAQQLILYRKSNSGSLLAAREDQDLRSWDRLLLRMSALNRRWI
jgi:segregation and condensation protein A